MSQKIEKVRGKREIKAEINKYKTLVTYGEAFLEANKKSENKITDAEKALMERDILMAKLSIQNLEWVLGKDLYAPQGETNE